MNKFTAETGVIISPYGVQSTEVFAVITALDLGGDVEVLRVEVRDPKTRTLHILPECLVDIITSNDETKSWLLSECAKHREVA